MTILLRPLINEKSMLLIKGDFYTFEVVKDATKAQIKKIVSEKFKVDVLDVRTVNLKGKKKSQRSRRAYYMEPNVKKAIVKVKKGQKIALFEQAAAEPEEEVEVRTAEGEVIAKTKEKKSFLRGTKVKIEKESRDELVKELAESKKKGESK
jgi:large subunit ribosomal protein L23